MPATDASGIGFDLSRLTLRQEAFDSGDYPANGTDQEAHHLLQPDEHQISDAGLSVFATLRRRAKILSK